MSKTRITILLFVFLSCFSTTVLSNDLDSLKRLLATNMHDTARVKLLNVLSKSYFSENPDSAIMIAATASKLAAKINYRPGLALALKNMGLGYNLKGAYVDAIKVYRQALDVYQKLGDKKGVANMLNNQGSVFFAEGDDAKSLELHLKSLQMSEEVGDTLRILTSLINIGGVYLNKVATYKKALDYFLRSYKLSLIVKDKQSIGTSTANLGETYYKLNDDSTALYYLNKAVEAWKGTEDLPYAANYLGRVYTRRKEFKKAIKILQDSYQLAVKLDTRLDMTQSLVALAEAFAANGQTDLAIASFKKAIETGTPLNALTEIKDSYQGLTAAYSQQSDFANAFKYQDLLLAIKDTIYNINTDKKLGTLQFTFDLEKKESEIGLLNKDKKIQRQEIQRQKLVRNSLIGGFAVVLLFAAVFFIQRNRISKEKKRSDELLLNILPEETAEELKATGTAKAKSFDLVSVLFTDFKNFTQASEKLSPEELVAEINHCYSEFDRIITKHGIEKIKTIGDSYMCAGGLPVTNKTHAFDVVSAGLEMINFVEKNKQEKVSKGQPYFELRLGVHTGPVVAGIVGIKKFAYDIWGDTVNTASRMESSGEIGKVNISGSTYELIKDQFTCSHRGKIQAKNKGMIDMYFVEGYSEI